MFLGALEQYVQGYNCKILILLKHMCICGPQFRKDDMFMTEIHLVQEES